MSAFTKGDLPKHIPLDVSSGSNVGLEHQVEFDRGGQLVASGRIPDVVLLDQLAKLRTTKVVNLPRQQATCAHAH